ncbi:hypothetical protein ScPMuIL_010097, partial [Solemya velum]
QLFVNFWWTKLKEYVFRLLRELPTSQLADLYNWWRTKGKLPLGDLKMVSFLF